MMSDRMRFGFGGSSQYLQQHQQQQQHNRCALCLDDDRNVTGGVCQHSASVESALSYLRNFGASVGGHHQASTQSSSYGGGGGGGVSSMMYNHGPQSSSPYDAVASTLQGAFGVIGSGSGGGSSPPVSPNNYTLIEYLLALRVQQEQQQNGYHNRHHHGRAPSAGRPPKPKSELGCLRECAFCKSNGETAEFYKSHFLKDPVGRVRCPILQRYQCPFCYATGENAHTRRYCPKNPNKMCFIKSEQLVKQNLQ